MRLGFAKPQLKWFIPYDVKGLLNASINDPESSDVL
jgi:hypothetical protein